MQAHVSAAPRLIPATMRPIVTVNAVQNSPAVTFRIPRIHTIVRNLGAQCILTHTRTSVSHALVVSLVFTAANVELQGRAVTVQHWKAKVIANLALLIFLNQHRDRRNVYRVYPQHRTVMMTKPSLIVEVPIPGFA